MDLVFALFALVVLAAHTAETVTGFGGTVIAVALGAQLLPLDFLLPVLVPVNGLLSFYIVARHHRYVDRKMLFSRILPFMAVGLAAGINVFNFVHGYKLKPFFGLFVVIISVYELYRLSRRDKATNRPLSHRQAALWLLPAGFIHGIYASGGPLVVWFAGRALADKKNFRSTLSALWLLLTSVLLINYTLTGRVSAATLRSSVLLLPALVMGAAAGEWLHSRVDARKFKYFVYGLLLVAGISLMITV